LPSFPQSVAHSDYVDADRLRALQNQNKRVDG